MLTVHYYSYKTIRSFSIETRKVKVTNVRLSGLYNLKKIFFCESLVLKPKVI